MDVRPETGLTRHFVVLPPLDGEFDEKEMLAKIRAALSARFPEYYFDVFSEGPRQDDSFVLIPVVGEVGDSGDVQLPLTAPYLEDMREIAEFLVHQFIGLPMRPN